MADAARALPDNPGLDYVLEDQIGFLLRQVHQAHAALFARRFGEDLTPMQWAAVAKLREIGPCSQNHLGRLTGMDAATIKGVVERLLKRGLAETSADQADRRRVVVRLTQAGLATFAEQVDRARAVTTETLAPLSPEERASLLLLLRRLRPVDDVRAP